MVSMSDYGLQSPIYKNISASALVKTGYGKLRGIFCASTTGGTLTLADAISGATPLIVNTFTLVAATYYNMGDVAFGTGLYATIANTADITLFYF